jgi:hypothetical protein
MFTAQRTPPLVAIWCFELTDMLRRGYPESELDWLMHCIAKATPVLKPSADA